MDWNETLQKLNEQFRYEAELDDDRQEMTIRVFDTNGEHVLTQTYDLNVLEQAWDRLN